MSNAAAFIIHSFIQVRKDIFSFCSELEERKPERVPGYTGAKSQKKHTADPSWGDEKVS